MPVYSFLLRALPLVLLLSLGLCFAPGASADWARVEHRGDKARIVLKLDSFSDKGRMRIRRVRVDIGASRHFVYRSHHPYWRSRFSRRFSLLFGRSLRVIVKRRNGAVRRLHLTVRGLPTPIPSDPDKPDPTPPAPEPPVYAPGISSLSPTWSLGETDFTTTCPGGKASLEVNLPDSVSIDGNAARSGSFKAEVAVDPGESFTVRVGSSGPLQTVRCRPDDLVLPEVEKSGSTEAKFFMVAPTLGGANNYVMVLNDRGTPVWWFKDQGGTPLDFKLIDSDTVAWVRGVGPFSVLSNHYDLRGLDGRLESTVSPVGFGADHHDIQPTPDGGYLLLIYAPRDCPNTPSDCEDLSAWGKPAQSNVIDGVIQKVDAQGNLVWQWNSRDHISLSESDHWLGNMGPAVLPNGSPAYDIIHLNSVEPDGNGFIFSARHLDAVYRVDASTGSIDWKLGGSATPEGLTVADDPFAANPLAGQHDARVLADGTVTIHDNGTLRGRPPRMVRYRISSGTASLLESLSDSSKAPGSFCCGGGRRMPGGHWAVSWGAVPLTAEYDENGSPVLRMYWPSNLFSYRVVPVTEGQLSLSALRAGMDSQFPR